MLPKPATPPAPPRTHRLRDALLVVALLAAVLIGGRVSSASVPAGVPDGVTLTAEGTLRIREAGAVVDARDVAGMIYVEANDVTITRSRITFGGYTAIRVGDGIRGTVVTDSDIICTDATKGRGIAFGHYTATRVHVQGCLAPFRFSETAPAVITDSFVDGEPWGTQTGSSTTTASPTSTSAPTTTATASAPQPEPAAPDELMVSASSDRSGASPLSGATVSGSAAIFLSTGATGIERVEWSLDGTIRRTDDLYAPYDLVPGTGSSSGMLDTTTLVDGSHEVSARIVFGDQTTKTVTAGFSVSNGAKPVVSSPAGMPSRQEIIDSAGLSDPGALRPSGSVRVTTPGAVVENLDISGGITIDAPDVTVRNVRVTGSSSSVLVRATDRAPRSRIEHCEIKVTDQSRGGIGGYSEGMVVRHCDISGYSDGIKAERGALYEYNYIHPSRPAGSTYHLDGIQGSSDSDWTARYNVIDVPISVGGNSAILSSAHNGTTNYYIKNVVVEYNYLRGGNYVVYLTCGKNTADNCAFVDNYQLRGNVFATDGWRYGYARIESCARTTVEGNILSDGSPLPHKC
jgi:hypothetical protein